jgi:uncharacterized membrane protein YbhN (UPF0104 family)
MTATGTRRRWWTSLGVGVVVSLVFLWLTLRRVDLAAVGDALASVSFPVLALALLTRGAAFLALGLRSRFTIAPGGRLPYRELVRAHLLGYTGNNVLPLRLGELLRIDYLARQGTLSRSFLVGTVAVERLMDTVLLLCLFAVTVPTVMGQSLMAGSYPLLVAATVAAILAALVAVRWKALPGLVERMVRPLHPGLAAALAGVVERGSEGLTALFHARWAPGALGGTLLYWLSAMGSVRVVMAAFHLQLPWYAPVVVVAVTALGTALPSSPAFVGTYHYFSALGVSLLGVDETTAASFAIVAHAVAFVPFTLVGLVVFAGSIRVWARAVEEEEAQVGGDGEQVDVPGEAGPGGPP